MKGRHTISALLFCMIACCMCREKYVPALKEVTTDFLVVDGFINSGAGPTTISLSRTSSIYAAPKIVRETKAVVRVEAKNAGTSVTLTETSTGVYTHPQLTLNASDEYRVSIQTSNGKRYESDYSKYRRMPDIDSIPWKQTPDGLEIGADTHDDNTPVGYYQFKFDETWEIHSSYIAQFLIGKTDFFDPNTRQPDWSKYYCWKYDTSYTPIRIYSTDKLTRNRVSFYPLVQIPRGDEKISERYSLFLKAYVLSKEGFRYQEQLKKNTEQLGSIFDAQPTDNYGNMHCVSNPNEPVIGFVEVSEEKTKRIFIRNNELVNWNYNYNCPRTQENVGTDEFKQLIQEGWIPSEAAEYSSTGEIKSVFLSYTRCIDCTTRKGLSKKPSFW